MLGAAKLLRDVQVERLGAAAALGALWAPRPRQSHDPRQINAYDRAVTPFLARYYSEREISEIVWFVGSKHLQNVHQYRSEHLFGYALYPNARRLHGDKKLSAHSQRHTNAL